MNEENQSNAIETTADELFAGSEMPEVNEAALPLIESEKAAEAETEAVRAAIESGEMDAEGNLFDESIHAVDPLTGKPKLRADGTFALRRGRKKGGKISDQHVKLKAGPVETESNALMAAAANTIVMTVDSIALALLRISAEAPEKAALCQAWIAYLEQKDISEIPPAYMLILTSVAVYAPKLNAPEPRGRLAKLKLWWFERREKKRFEKRGGKKLIEKTEDSKYD